MINKLLVSVVVSALSYSCSSIPENTIRERMEGDKIICDSFSEQELEGLEKLILFFEKQTCGPFKDSKYRRSKECYENFFGRIEEGLTDEELNIGIPFEEQTQMYATLDQDFFEMLWILGQESIPDGGQRSYIMLNPNSNFIIFMANSSNENIKIKDYFDSYSATGDLPPSMIADIALDDGWRKVDDIKIKLLIVIHYLTLNDQIYRHS